MLKSMEDGSVVADISIDQGGCFEASGNWRDNQALLRGINVEAGKLVHPALQGMKL